LHGDDDATFLFEPLPDTSQALAVGNCGSDLGPKGANLASLRGRLSPAPLGEAVPRFDDPLLLGRRFIVGAAFGMLASGILAPNGI